MGAQKTESFVKSVGGEGGARRSGLLAPDLPAIRGINPLCFVPQDLDFLLGEAAR